MDAARVSGAQPGAGQAAAYEFATSSASGYLRNVKVAKLPSPGAITIRVRGRVASLVPGLPIIVTQVAQAPVERFTTP